MQYINYVLSNINLLLEYGIKNTAITVFDFCFGIKDGNAIMNKEFMEIPYKFNDEDYKIIVPLKTKGNTVIIRIYYDDHDFNCNTINIDKLIKSVAGPKYNFHNQNITPKMLGINKKIHMEVIDRGFKTISFEPDDILKI